MNNRFSAFGGAFLILSGSIGAFFCLALFFDASLGVRFLEIIYRVTGQGPKAYAASWLQNYASLGVMQGLVLILAGLYFSSQSFRRRIEASIEDLLSRDAGTGLYLRLSGLILLAGILLRLSYYLADHSLWMDPACLAVALIKTPLGDLTGPLFNGQVAPLGFLLVSKIFGRLFDYREFALTFLPLVFGLSAIIAGAGLSRRLFDRVHSLAMTAFLCFSIPAVYYSTEFKQYSGDLFFTTLILYFSVKAYQNRWPLGDCVKLALSGLVGVWFSHAAIIVCAGSGLGLAVAALFVRRDHPGDLLPLAAVGALWIINILINYYGYTAGSVPGYKASMFDQGFAPFPPRSPGDWKWYLHTLLGLFSYPLGFGEYLYLAPLAFFLYGLFRAFKTDRDVAIIILTPILVLAVLSLMGKYPIITGIRVKRSRLLLFTLPCLYYLMARGLEGISQKTASRFVFGLGLVFLLNQQFISLANAHIGLQESRGLIRFLEEHKAAEDSVWLDSRVGCAFEYYTRGRPIAHRFLDDIEEGYDWAAHMPLPGQGGIWVLVTEIAGQHMSGFYDYLSPRGRLVATRTAEGVRLMYFKTAAEK